MTNEWFAVVCEIEPPTRPDLTRVRHQIGVPRSVARAFLIPGSGAFRGVQLIPVARCREVGAALELEFS
jgi:hypothetical protein